MNTIEQIKILLAQIKILIQRIFDLERENKELRRRLNQDSNNSSKPPSSDPLWDRKTRASKNKKGKKRRGGQKGHKGSKLNRFSKVDHYQEHEIAKCPYCLSLQLSVKKIRTKQIIDIPRPSIEVTDHQFYDYSCENCGRPVENKEIKDFKQEVQYGTNIKALVNYLNVYQLLPYKRLVQLIEDIYGHRISQGSISNFNEQINEKLSGFISGLKEYFRREAQVFHGDETGCIVDKKNHWVHVYSDNSKTLLQGHPNRGRKAMKDIDVLPKAKGTLIHDRFASYNGYTQLSHGLCNAHILRELKALEQNTKLSWPSQIKSLLLIAKNHKDEGELSPLRIKRIQNKYEQILREQRHYYQQIQMELNKKNIRGKPKRTKDHNLYLDLWKYRKEILKFIHEPEVPFDNNQAERDLRMFKVKMKISSMFHSDHWLNVHASIRSYISTASKNQLNILGVLKSAHSDSSFAAQLAV